MVALPSRRVRHLYELGHACDVELPFHELVNQVAHSSIWWRCAASKDSPLLFRVNLRRVHNREPLDDPWNYCWDSDLRILGINVA